MNKKEKEFKLSTEDNIRMKRLSQEVLGRLTEMNMIVASTMKNSQKGFSKVHFMLPENGGPLEIEFLTPNGLDKKGAVIMSCGHYIDPPGICKPCFPL